MTEPSNKELRIAELEAEIDRLRSGGPRLPRWIVSGSGVALEHQPAWEDWLAHHGLPPLRDIPRTGEIIYDSATGGLSCLRTLRDAEGKAIFAGNELALERVTVVPLPPLAPFPPGLTVTCE